MRAKIILISLILFVAGMFLLGQGIEIRRAAPVTATATNAIAHTDGFGTNTYLTNVILDVGIVSNISSYGINEIKYLFVTYVGEADRIAAINSDYMITNTSVPMGDLATYIYNQGTPGLHYVWTNHAATNVVISFSNTVNRNFHKVYVSNDFNLILTGYVSVAPMAIQLIPHNYVSNYTITTDSSWERYGANFTSSDITLVSNKSCVLSVTSWGTTAAEVAAAYKSEQ